MKKNNIIKNSLFVFAALILAALIEIFIFNGIKMHNIGDNKGEISLTDKINISDETIKVEVVDSDENNSDLFTDSSALDTSIAVNRDEIKDKEYIEKNIKVLSINFDKIYTDRINIKYNINGNVELPAILKVYNEYGDPIYKETKIAFLKDFKNVTSVVDDKISEIKIQLDYDEDIQLKIKDVSIRNDFCFNIYRYILMSLFLVTIVLIYILRKTIFQKIEYLFVLIAMCAGVALILLTPCLTFYSWDDHVHLNNMYLLFENGEIDTSKSFNYSKNLRLSILNVPKSYEDFNRIHNYLNDNASIKAGSITKENEFVTYDSYTYIPSAIILKICKWLKLPYTLTFYLGKLANLLVYVSIMFFAIKRAKVGKKLLFVLALLPTTIFLASQYSRDAIITAGIYFAISTFLNCYCAGEKMDRKNLLIFVISILIASLSKMIYAPMLLLLLIMPKERFIEEKNSKWIKLLAIILVLVSMSTYVLPTVNSSPGTIGDVRGGNTSTGSQFQLIKEQPVSFTKVFSKYIVTEISTKFIYNQTLGGLHRFVTISGFEYFVLLIMLILCAVCSSKDEHIEKMDLKLRLLLIGLSVLIVCLICGSMYLSFTPIGYTTVIGAQPRYYVPLLFGVYVAFKQNKIQNKFDSAIVMKIISLAFMYIYFYLIYNYIFVVVCA